MRQYNFIFANLRSAAAAIAVTALVLCSCDKQLDIIPKGQVTLGKLSELELLLNQEMMLNDGPAESLGMICGETLGMFEQVATIMAQTNTCAYAYLTGDESVNRAVLTSDDMRYNAIYKFISSMNVILEKADDAEGSDALRTSIKAEAHVMRAWFHFLAVGIYAKQYDAATAAKNGGIAYSTSSSVSEKKAKLSLEESYQMILADLTDEIIADLPDSRGTDVTRGEKAWGYAARAMVLFQMKRYSEALADAEKALAIRGEVFDRSFVKETGQWIQDYSSSNNILYIEGSGRVSPTLTLITPETYAKFEADDFIIKYEGEKGWSASYGLSFSGLEGVYSYFGWTTSCNVYGVTSEMMYYTAAECLIREGKYSEGLAYVDKVRKCRVENAAPSSASTEAEAMAILEDAKWAECIGTPFNFLDMKRRNSETAYKRDVVKDLGSYGKFTIMPDSQLWVMAFPANAVRYNDTLKQNYL